MPSTTPSSSDCDPGPEQITLLDGTVAELGQEKNGWSLQINGIRQSHIGPAGADPALAASRWMLAALGADLPQRCAVLGGGLLTLPRVIAARRPGAEQVVLELEPALVRLATDRFGLPEGVDLRLGNAREWLDDPDVTGPASDFDAIVIDIFTGGRIPPDFTCLECFTAAREKLGPAGRLVINSVAGPQLDFTRRELATMQAVFAHVAMIVQGSALKGLRFGNATLIGSQAPLDVEAIRANLAQDSSRGALVTDLAPLVGDAQPIREAEQVWSPEPDLPNFDAMLKALDEVKKMQRQVQETFGPVGGREGDQGHHKT